MATFKDVCDYMSASFNVKRAKILFWKYSLIFELTTPVVKAFDLWFWAYTALFEVTTPLYRDHMSSFHSSNGCGNLFFSHICPVSLPENFADGCVNLKSMAIYPFYCDNPELGARCRISTYVMRFLSYGFNHPDSGSVHE